MGAKLGEEIVAMEQRTLRNVNNYLNTNIYSYFEIGNCDKSEFDIEFDD